MQHSYRGSIEQWLAAGVLGNTDLKASSQHPTFPPHQAHFTQFIRLHGGLLPWVPQRWCWDSLPGCTTALQSWAHVRARGRRKEAAPAKWRRVMLAGVCLHHRHFFCKGNIGVNNIVWYELCNCNWMASVSLTLDWGCWRERFNYMQIIAGQHVSNWMDKIHVLIVFWWKCNRLYTFMNSST